MGKNEIILGDAYELIKTVPDKSIDLIVTDPPYQFTGLHADTGILKGRESGYVHELMDGNIYRGIDLSILNEFVRVLKKINVYIWCSKEQIYDYLTFFAKERKCNFEILIWAKQNPSPFYGSHYLADKEYCLYFWETGAKLDTRTFDDSRTVFFSKVNKTDKERYAHPTIKPQEIIETLIKNSGGGLILDPFCGSGTTCAAAKAVGCDYLGFEISEKWWKVANDRLEGITKKEADKGFVQMKLL